MRIVAGTHRSRILESPRNDFIRPTSDKVRGAIFNMLQSRGLIEGAIVIDLFCGTGALGLEALSRGADFCLFVDHHPSSLDVTRRNIDTLQETGRARRSRADAGRLGVRPADMKPATLVFLDPPYAQGLAVPALNSLVAGRWMEEGAHLIVEESQPFDVPEQFHSLLEKAYGETRVSLLRYSQPV